ncbi:MAG: M1 family aminopeptidase [Chitinophagaceae bacterium]
MKYYFRQITFIIAAVLFIGLGLLLTKANFGGPDLHKNAPYAITYVTGFLSLFSIFVCTLFCAGVVLRDSTYEMESIIFTTSIRRLQYFAIRLLGLLLSTFLVLTLTLLGLYLGTSLANPEQLGPFRFSYFIHPLLILGLPNILFCSNVIFSAALFTRSIRMVYITGVLLFILYFLASILGNSPLMASSLKITEPGLFPYLADPFGLTAFFYKTRPWTVEARNNDLFPVEGAFLANRLLWLIVAGILLFVSYRHFRFRLPAPAKAGKQKQSTSVATTPYRKVAATPRGFRYNYAAFTSQLKLEITSVFKHIPFLVMMALWVFLYAIELKENILYGPYGTRFYAGTGFIVEEFLSIRPALLLLVFYASELINRERAANIQGLVFSTPVPNILLWSAKCATLAALVGTIVSANICIGIGLQLFTGYYNIDLPAYLSLYYYSGLPLFLFAVLIVFIQTLIPNKYAGMLLSLVVICVIIFARMLGISHSLLRFATLPDLQYSHMNGFGHYVKAVNWYLLYWTSFAAILSLLAAALWKGSTHTTLWQRVRSMGSQWGRTGKLFLVLFLLIWIATGLYIYTQTNTASTARGNKQLLNWQVAYEQKYKLQADQPQPYITAIKTNTDLYPQESRYTVQGSYTIRNESAQPISTLWLGVDPEVTHISFSVPDARLEMSDDVFKLYRYTLKTPLQPGDTASLRFSMEIEKNGFTTFNSEHSIVSNGSYIELEKYVPYFGYNGRFEITDETLRKEHGLSPLIDKPYADSNYHLVSYETTISANSDQQIVTVGSLQKKWQAGDRNYFHYKTDAPIAFRFAFSAAAYAIKSDNYKGIALNIFYHPGQTYNLPTLLQSMKDAIDYGSTNFSPYPLKQLTLAEIPQYPGAATAYPGVLFSTEKLNFMSNLNDSNRFNNVYAITAHETGHQWWANKLAPLAAPGSAMLTESLAKYTELMTSEKRFGKMHLRNFLKTENNLYFAMRGGEKELPLSQSEQPFVYYQKGGLTLYTIKEMLGEVQMNRALQRLIAKHAFPGKKATVADLINELYAAATPEQQKQMDEYLHKVMVYSNSIKLVSCDPLPGGQFILKLQVNISKTDQTAEQSHSVTPGDLISIAVFEHPADQWNRQEQPLYLQQHVFSKTTNLISITVNKKPSVIILDPFYALRDADPDGNILDIGIKKDN